MNGVGLRHLCICFPRAFPDINILVESHMVGEDFRIISKFFSVRARASFSAECPKHLVTGCPELMDRLFSC